MPEAGLGLGANLGDRGATLLGALKALDAAADLKLTAVSRIYRTEPWGVLDQPDFFNLCALVETKLAPLDLLELCKRIEHDLGRTPTYRWGPRLIDIDVLYLSSAPFANDRLTLPHPGLWERMFVLAPLSELVSQVPGTEHDLANLIAARRAASAERIEVDEAATRLVRLGLGLST